MEITVTVKHMPPSFWKMVSVQKVRNSEAPAVVMALPSAAPPMDCTANCVRQKRTIALSLTLSSRRPSARGSSLAYLCAMCSE